MPSIWKKTFITVIFKSGNSQDILNYRPISIMGSIGKVLHTIMSEKITDKVLQYIIHEQYDFVKGRSTITNLIIYIHYISEALEDYKQVDAVYFDFSKGFASANHELLIYEIHKLGINGEVLEWIKSFVSDREMSVRIKSNLSNSFENSCGLPQGSSLEPLLLLLFTNNITQGLKDVQVLIYRIIRSIRDQVHVQKQNKIIVEWLNLN